MPATTAVTSTSISVRCRKMCSTMARSLQRAACLSTAPTAMSSHSGAKCRQQPMSPMPSPPPRAAALCRTWVSTDSTTARSRPSIPIRTSSRLCRERSTRLYGTLSGLTRLTTTITISVAQTTTICKPASSADISTSTTRRATLPTATAVLSVTTPLLRVRPTWRISIRTTHSTNTRNTSSTTCPSVLRICRLARTSSSTSARPSPHCAMARTTPRSTGIFSASLSKSLSNALAASTTSRASASCVCSSQASSIPSSCVSAASTSYVARGASMSRTSTIAEHRQVR